MGEEWVYTMPGSNRYLVPPIFFYLPYTLVSYFESKYHPTPTRYSVSKLLILIITVYADWCKRIALL